MGVGRRPSSRMSKQWSNGTFDCCSDVGTCCMGTFCGCCLVYSTAEQLGESGLLYLLLSCITPCIPVMMLRGKAREMYDIEGSTGTTRCAPAAATAARLSKPTTSARTTELAAGQRKGQLALVSRKERPVQFSCENIFDDCT